MPIVIASPKCQVVIPKKERDKIGIKPGTQVAVEAVGDHIEIRPVPENPVNHYSGIYRDGPSLTRALLKERTKEREHEGRKGS